MAKTARRADARTGPGQPRPEEASRPPAPRQRWRLTFARAADPDRQTHRDIVEGWVDRLGAAGLPLPHPSGRFRSPLAFAAPLPVGIECREELADLWLRDLLPMWRVREAVTQTLPPTISLTRLDDAWVGEPTLAAAIRSADYRIGLAADAPFEQLQTLCDRFMGAAVIERDRARGSATVRQDIRPLIDALGVSPHERALHIRTRFLPDRGTGRPEDVRAVLETWLGAPIAWGATIRERLVLAPEAVRRSVEPS